MITVLKSLSGTYFSASIPDLSFTIGGSRAGVVMTVDGVKMYDEHLYQYDGSIELTDLSALFTSYAHARLSVDITITITDLGDNDAVIDTKVLNAKVVYCAADFTQGTVMAKTEDFLRTHFLSIYSGDRISALGRLEFLHYIGTDSAAVKATYVDGSTADFAATKVQGNNKYSTIDVSPSRFTKADKELDFFVVKAGERTQKYMIDWRHPDCAPILMFENSFGCDELMYCVGKHQVSPSFKRTTVNVLGKTRNIEIVENRLFKADTGYLTIAQQNWVDELFRAERVHVVNFVNGQPVVGKEVTLTESKSEVSNLDDEIARFTFSYQYAQRIHNVIDLQRAGRIFDNTFDNTFD